ncbi:hypothetical protein FB567DRAFT_347956 [Paraphoma chrysanthemicola]|uniref:Uncharacterized protein n=1 Tax=Paraphoma chrysanthemicola TaxID=798071 RepID=A0A8K0R5T0_9PLEO|nr:hypothetical protein FB567DRAFT_347956 [Paraphoma chrysanthemicola]
MSALISHAQRTAGNVGTQLQSTTNKFLPPAEREKKLKDLRDFTNRNPKLTAFLAFQIALAGPPLVLFLIFAASTLLISLSTALLCALTSALIYTFFVVGIALFFLVPTLFLASFAATFFFLWCLAAYLVLQRFNEGEAPGKRGTRVGDTLHGPTGDRLDWMAGGKDRRPVEISMAQDVADKNGSEDSEDYDRGGNPSRHGGDAHLIGNEWEAKWSEGTQQRQKEFAKGLDIKVDTIAPPQPAS